MGRSTQRFVFFKFIYFVAFVKEHIALGLVNGVLNETCTHSCLQF